MKRTIAAIVFVFITASFLPYNWIAPFLSAACTNTTNMSLCKPAIADSGWGTNLNNNFETIDTHDHTSGKGVVITPKTTGEVFHTTAASCPAGSSPYTVGQGFAVVGLPSGGTNEGTVGIAMTNLLDRPHNHTYTDVVNHLHSVDPPSTSVGIADSGHTHPYINNPNDTGGDAGFIFPGNDHPNVTTNTTSNTTGITASVDIAAFNSANPTGGVATGTTATAATSNVISYIQLRPCRQN